MGLEVSKIRVFIVIIIVNNLSFNLDKIHYTIDFRNRPSVRFYAMTSEDPGPVEYNYWGIRLSCVMVFTAQSKCLSSINIVRGSPEGKKGSSIDIIATNFPVVMLKIVYEGTLS